MVKGWPQIKKQVLVQFGELSNVVKEKRQKHYNEGSVKSSMKERVLVIKVEGGGDAFLRHVRSCLNH